MQYYNIILHTTFSSYTKYYTIFASLLNLILFANFFLFSVFFYSISHVGREYFFLLGKEFFRSSRLSLHHLIGIMRLLIVRTFLHSVFDKKNALHTQQYNILLFYSKYILYIGLQIL